MVVDDATVGRMQLHRNIRKIKIYCAKAVVGYSYSHHYELKHGRLPTLERINKIKIKHNNRIERRLELNLTCQKEGQWNNDGAIDINDKDLIGHDAPEESDDGTSDVKIQMKEISYRILLFPEQLHQWLLHVPELS